MNKKNSEMDYVFDRLSSQDTQVALVLPIGFFQRYQEKDLRTMIFEEWKVVWIFDVSTIFHPFTGVMFNLLIVSKEEPKEVYFSKYLWEDTFIWVWNYTGRSSNLQNKQEVTNKYAEYIKNIEELLVWKDISWAKNIKLWQTPYIELDYDKLQTSFYEPELVANDKKLQEEHTETLESMVDILKPRREKTLDEWLIIKTKDFKYPLNLSSLTNEIKTTVELQKGDILFSDSFSGTQKFFLVHKDYSKKIYASSFLTVLRPKSHIISSEYLFLYLQSDLIQKYFTKYTWGGMIQRIRTSDTKKMPVIIPELKTMEKSNSIFEKLFLISEDNILEQINKEIFEKREISTKPIQREFVFEKIEDLKVYKHEILEKILKDDFRELEMSKKHEMYKSFVILAWSILEAYLTDWLAEEDGCDYFSSEEEILLVSLIHQLFGYKEGRIPDDKLFKMASNIKDKRNLIHPKKYFNSKSILDEKTCNRILWDLRLIIKKRK